MDSWLNYFIIILALLIFIGVPVWFICCNANRRNYEPLDDSNKPLQTPPISVNKNKQFNTSITTYTSI